MQNKVYTPTHLHIKQDLELVYNILYTQWNSVQQCGRNHGHELLAIINKARRLASTVILCTVSHSKAFVNPSHRGSYTCVFVSFA